MNKRIIIVCIIAGAILLGLALPALRSKQSLQDFLKTVKEADKVILFEGLPHQYYEIPSLEEELKTKAVRQLNNYPFYHDPLALNEEDASTLTDILASPTTYEPFSGEKKCGGFHPGYALEWSVGTIRYRALICFGCQEIKLFGTGVELRKDIEQTAYKKLRELLKDYRKNRPAKSIKSF